MDEVETRISKLEKKVAALEVEAQGRRGLKILSSGEISALKEEELPYFNPVESVDDFTKACSAAKECENSEFY